MKTLIVTLTTFCLLPSAHGLAISKVSLDQPACFGREYSEKHMSSHPLQTVKQLKVKIFKDEYNSEQTVQMAINADIKRPMTDGGFDYKPYHSGMYCEVGTQKLDCSIDCDGGRATVTWDARTENDEIIFTNEGFVVYGGCGEEELETLWLEPTKGGDDVFRLYALPPEFCAP